MLENWVEQLEIFGLVVLAGFLGGLVGLEREHADKPAGLRTHMITGAAAALFVQLGQTMIHAFNEDVAGFVRADPIRVMQAIIVGVSFLGAGTIFTNDKKDRVHGLTTAASLLLTTGIGIAVGVYQIILGIAVTVLSLIVLRAIQWWERRWLEGSGSSTSNSSNSDEDLRQG